MKKTLKIMMLALIAFGMMACGEKKLTEKDLKAAEATLFNEDGTMKADVAPSVAEKYCLFAEQNPDNPSTPMWLYLAMEINAQIMNSEKSLEIGEQIVKQYPQSQYAPKSLFLAGSYVYNDQLNDTAQAHVTLDRLIKEYPESDLVDDAQKYIEYLGLTPEEIMTLIIMSQMENQYGD